VLLVRLADVLRRGEPLVRQEQKARQLPLDRRLVLGLADRHRLAIRHVPVAVADQPDVEVASADELQAHVLRPARPRPELLHDDGLAVVAPVDRPLHRRAVLVEILEGRAQEDLEHRRASDPQPKRRHHSGDRDPC
jgi:hypothetical protein